jgi:glycosyltransferase involved in cell wall biosynthesis
MKLSIIVPAYNEEQRIESTLNAYSSFFDRKLKNNYEIIVIPNNCNDNTTSIVSKFSKKHKKVRSKEFKYYIGKAGAIIEGFKLSKGDFVGFTDADNSAPPESFFKLFDGLQGYDGAIGSRWLKDSQINLKQSFSRRFFSRSYNLLIKLLLQLDYYDTQCGCKIFKKDQVDKVIPFLGNSRWAFDVDLLYHLKKFNSKIKEVPIIWADDPRTHLNLFRASSQMLLSLIRLRLLYSPFQFIIHSYDKTLGKWNQKKRK